MNADHVITRSRLIGLPNSESSPFPNLSLHVWLSKLEDGNQLLEP